MEDKNKISYGSVNWLLFFNIVLYVIITEIVIVVNSYVSYNEPDTYITRIVVQLFAILLPVIVFTRSKKINVKEFYRIKPISIKNAGLIALLGVCAQFIGIILKFFVKFIFGIFKIPYSGSSGLFATPDSSFQIILMILALVLLPAIAEELLFRGLVLRSYEKWGTRSAIIISSLLFGLLHLDISSALATVFLGLLLSYIVVKTDSVVSGVILHLANNGTALISMLLLSRFPSISYWMIIPVFLIAVIVFFPLFFRFNKVNIQSKFIPQKRTISSEIIRTVFTLPILLSIIAFIIIQLYIFNIF